MIAALQWLFFVASAVFCLTVIRTAYADHCARQEWGERAEREARARGEDLKRRLVNARELARSKEQREWFNEQRRGQA